MIFRIDYLCENYMKYNNQYQKIDTEVTNGNLFKIKRGLYSDSRNENPFYIANIIYSPSYISFETALSYYGLIPERVELIMSATYVKNKTKKYDNIYGTFYYQDVNHNAYPYGIDTIVLDGQRIFIASREKALTDTISLVSPRKSMKEIKNLLFEDLRINEDLFEQLDKNKIIELCDYYHNTSLKYLKKLLEKEMSNND